MDAGYLKTLFIGVPMLVFGIWQYVSVSRELERGRQQDAEESSADPGHPERE